MRTIEVPVTTLRDGYLVAMGDGTWLIRIHRVRNNDNPDYVDVLYSFVGQPDMGLIECTYTRETTLRLFSKNAKKYS